MIWIEDILADMDKQLGRIEKVLDGLTEEEIWRRPKASMNSIGNLCLHLAGNEYQNLVSGVGGRPFIRERSCEFDADGGWSGAELITRMREVRAEAKVIAAALTEGDLAREVDIRFAEDDWKRMYRNSAADREPAERRRIGQLFTQVGAHYGYHAGQIVVFAKLQRDFDASISGQYH